MKKYYDRLDISESASLNEIKFAFRKLVKKYHPDRINGDKEKFIDIYEAYKILLKARPIDIDKGNINKHNQEWEKEKNYSSQFNHFNYKNIRSDAEKYAEMNYENFMKTSFMYSISGIKLFFAILAYISTLCFGISLFFLINSAFLFSLIKFFTSGFEFWLLLKYLYMTLLFGIMTFLSWHLILNDANFKKISLKNIWIDILETKNDNDSLMAGMYLFYLISLPFLVWLIVGYFD